MTALVVATIIFVLLPLAFVCDGSTDLSVQDLLITVLEILVGWGASPVAFALPISKPVSRTQTFHDSSNLGSS